MGATSKSKRIRRNQVAKRTKKCPLCPLHSGENARRRPKKDKYKSKRKGKC